MNGFSHENEWDVPPLPGYMQQGLDMDEFCQTLDEVLREGADTISEDEEPQDHNIAVWNAIRQVWAAARGGAGQGEGEEGSLCGTGPGRSRAATTVWGCRRAAFVVICYGRT